MATKTLKIGLLATDFNQGTGPATYLAALQTALAGRHIVHRPASACPADADLIHLVDAKRAGVHQLDSLAAPIVADFHDHYWTSFRPYPCPDLPLRWLRQKQLLRHHLEVIRRARAVIVHGNAVAQAVTAVIANSHLDRAPAVHVVPYPVKTVQTDLGARVTSPAKPNLILMVGRDLFRKGFSVIVKALPRVIAAVPGAHLAVLGDEYWHTRAVARLLARGLPVELRPAVGPAELDDWYGRAAVLVLPSFEEAFGMAPVEAMLRGLPVVASRAGGIPEAVEDNVSGLLHGRGDAPDLAAKLIAVLTDPGLRERLIAGGLERARSFTLERTAQALDAASQAALEQP